MASAARVLSINIAERSQPQTWSDSGLRTGINKEPAQGLVSFENDHVAGDTVVDRKHHGGYDQAVYAYAREDAVWWEEKIGRAISHGQFGENLTTEGLDLTHAIIGEQWRIGDVLLEVSSPRIPCRIFAGFWDRPGLVKEFAEARRPGTYLRIIEEGMFEAKASITIVHKPAHGCTIRDLYGAWFGESEKLEALAAVKELATKDREWISKKLAQK